MLPARRALLGRGNKASETPARGSVSVGARTVRPCTPLGTDTGARSVLQAKPPPFPCAHSRGATLRGMRKLLP
eukprot:scaffold751_cov395-Prasinococcus_capsulatus_cf.AAC.1